MIPDIKELNFPKKDGKQYATLTQATAKADDMGEKTITTQVKIDGNIVPDFSFDWEVEFQGEKYIMPLRIPAGLKDNKKLKSEIDLTFQHWAIYQLKRWSFVTIQQIAAGTYLPDEEVATVSLNLGDFCTLFGQVLSYYFGNTITIDLNPAWQYKQEAIIISISHTKIWNVLIDAFYNKYGVRWEIKPASDNSNTVKGGERYVIRVGYPTTEVDHIFEYGFEGGLLKVERQVQSEEIRNVLKGRGGETNIPFRYFKNTDPNNKDFRPDPDWVEELANIYFPNLMPATFRSYVQGWKAAHKSKYPRYTAVGEANAYAPWAYRKGYTDTKFAPVEFVADEITINPTTGDKQVEILPGYSPYVKQGSSLDKYGPLPDTLDNNDDIYPTLQGTGLDIAVDVEQIESDDVQESTGSEAIVSTFDNKPSITVTIEANERKEVQLVSESFTVEQGMTANLNEGPKTFKVWKEKDVGNLKYFAPAMIPELFPDGISEGADFFIPIEDNLNIVIEDASITVINYATGEKRSASGITAGMYYFVLNLKIHNTAEEKMRFVVSCEEPKLISTVLEEDKWRNTFNIWVKNIWDSTRQSGETDTQYAERVWKPVLGDREGDTAKVVFTSGALAVSEDYEFTIVDFPTYDTSKTYGGAQSHWRIKLAKSEAELEATGLYVPSTKKQGKAGDTFVFIGTEMTHVPYVVDAEIRLDDWKKGHLGEVKEIKPTAVVTTDRVRLSNEGKPNALINQLRVGNSLRLFDKRFFNEPGKAYETLYLQSITYTYREPISDDAAVNPDVEIVLGNEYATSANPVSMMQSEISALQKQLGSISNVEQIVRAVGDKLYLRKDGISDLSLSPTQFFSLLTSGDFRAGLIGGVGWGFYKDENGNWVLEADKINARKELQTNSLVTNQVEGRGGMIVESAAAMDVAMVSDSNDGYVCYFRQKDGSVANLFHLNDVAYCQRFTPENGELKYYRRKVTAIGVDSITLSKTDVDGSGIPEEGDNIVHFGNYVDKTRQYVKVRDVVNGGYERYIEGLDSVSAEGTEYYFVGRQYGLYGGKPRWFIGDPDGEYAEWINGKLNIKGSLSIGSTIGGDTFEEYIKKVSPPVKQEDIEQFVNNIVDPKIAGIQNQIDGVIETWFYNGVPTLSNYPVSEWNTEALKIQHLGDLYYDNDTGTAYRFSKNGSGAYYWNTITDDAITKALAAAKTAQDTADGKRRVFTAQPTAQQIYDVGDLWVNATYGTQYSNDILRCITHKDAGAAFNIAHWTLASKYTDDTLANQVKEQVDNLSTTVNNVSNTVNGLKNFTDTAFLDGIIDRSEASAIQTYLKNVETAQKEVAKAYDSVDSNTLLPSENKATLENTKAAFDSAANALIVKITEVIDDNVATSEERAAVNAAYTEFNTKYGDFIYALNQANAAIMGTLDININKLAYLTKAMKELTTIQNGLILSSVVSLGVNNEDFTTQTTYSGISGIHDDSKIGGGIAAWYGGDMIDKFDYYDASTGKFNIPDGVRVAMALDRMDGTGYRANGNLWWDVNGVVHADPLSFFVGEATVGALLASFQVVLQADGKHPDYLVPQVPFQSITVADGIKIGDGYLKWDGGNRAFYVVQADGTAANFYATGGVSALGMSAISGGGTGGAGALYELVDVKTNSAGDGVYGAVAGSLLSYNGTSWEAIPQSSIVPDLTGYATISAMNTALSGKVDKVSGKGLSTNDFTTSLLNKLNGIAAGANKYVLPTASATVKGGVKVGETLAIASEELNLKSDIVATGTYTKVTVDTYGRVTAGATLAAADIPSLNWSKITSGKPTTVAGYGITDAYTKTEVNTKLGDGSVTKVGTATVGATNRPIYLNAGVPTAGTYTFGNASGNAPISNGTVNINLNADLLDGLQGSAYAQRQTWNDMLHSGNEFTFASPAFSGDIYLNYRTASGTTDGNIRRYHFGNGKGGSLAYIEQDFFSGNAASATQLQAARTIWGQSFNGTANVSGNMTGVGSIAASGAVTAGSFGVTADSFGNKLDLGRGYIELYHATPFIDFHYGRSTADYTSRIIEEADGRLLMFPDVRIGSRLYIGNQSTNAIEWDAANNAFKFNGNLYATGGISALGASFLSATSISVSSLTASTINLNDKIRFGTAEDALCIAIEDNYNIFIGDSGNKGYVKFISNIGLGVGADYSISVDGVAYLESVQAVSMTINGATFTHSGNEIYVTISGTRYKLTKVVG